MTAAFTRFSSLKTSHFRSVCLGQRIAELRDELDESREVVQWQCLSAIVMLAVIAYLLARNLDSLWALGLIMPLFAIGSASLQHTFAIYRYHVHTQVMPSLCESFGRLRYTMGAAPDLQINQMVDAGLLPHHDRHMVEDAFFGDYRGHQLTLALVDLWQGVEDGQSYELWEQRARAVVLTIHCPTEPARLPVDELSQTLNGQPGLELRWSDGYLMLAIPCTESPFDLGGLFEAPEEFMQRLERVAALIQIAPNLIDHLLDGSHRSARLA